MAAVPPRRRYAVGANTGVRRAIKVNERHDDLKVIIDVALREMAAEGATGSAHRQFSPRCKWTISACCILFFLLF